MLVRSSYQPKLPRWSHQEQAIHALHGHDGFALFMEMRTGKTKTILDEFGQDELAGEIGQLLVIAPAGVYRTWQVDAEKHLSDDLLQHIRIACWESGPSAAQKTELKKFMAYEGPRILLVNVEALSTVKMARELCTAFLNAGATTLVIDESTVIKNPVASRTKFCLKLSPLAAKRRILSGLPSPQSPLDLYPQFEFLRCMALEKFPRFTARYAVVQQKPYGPGGRMIPIITGYQRLDELQARIAQHSFRVRLSDCYDLPEKMFMRRDVEMTDEQKVAYAQMKRYAVAELEGTERVTATVVLTQMLRLHQILAGHTMSDDGNLIDIPENKTKEILNILENVDGKAIIWAAYDADVRKITTALQNEYGEDSTARFWGGNRDTREHEEALFKTSPNCRFMIATAAAGGRGRTWDMADTVIYHSNTFSLEHRMQSEERTQAVGKKQSVAFFDLMTMGTVEEKIVMALRSKMNLSDAVTGDQWRSWIV